MRNTIVFSFIILSAYFSNMNHVMSSIAYANSETTNPTDEKGKPWESWDVYRKQMIEISEDLGVTCTYCHQTKNYRDNSKKEFQIAKKHIELVEVLKNQFKDSLNQEVNCYLCHKGQPKISHSKKQKLAH